MRSNTKELEPSVNYGRVVENDGGPPDGAGMAHVSMRQFLTRATKVMWSLQQYLKEPSGQTLKNSLEESFRKRLQSPLVKLYTPNAPGAFSSREAFVSYQVSGENSPQSQYAPVCIYQCKTPCKALA